MDGMLRIETLLAASTLIDVAAIVIGWWIVRAAARQHAAASEAVARLRGDLGRLVADAEERGAALEASLGVREKTLRALLKEAGKLTDTPRAARPSADAAEARLLRDLELRLGARGA